MIKTLQQIIEESLKGIYFKVTPSNIQEAESAAKIQELFDSWGVEEKVKKYLIDSQTNLLKGVIEMVECGIKDGEDTILAIQNAVRRDIAKELKAQLTNKEI